MARLHSWPLAVFLVIAINAAAATTVGRFEYLHYRPVVPSRPTVGRPERAHAASVSIEFAALGRRFRLLLTPDLTTLGPHLTLVGPGRSAGLPDSEHLQLYQGTVQGEPGSFVFGSLRDGVFSGTVEIPPAVYSIEPPQVLAGNRSRHGGATRPASPTPPPPPEGAHSVIFSNDDVKLPRGKGCGFMDHDASLHDEHMKQHAEKLFTDEELDQAAVDSESLPESYPESPPESDSNSSHLRAERWRRFISSRFIQPPSGNPNRDQAGVCTMSIETDPILWRYVYDMFEGNVPRARDYLISLIGGHMIYVNRIYAEEKFNDGQYQHEGLQFRLQKLLITDDSSCAPDYVGEPSRFCPDNVDYSDYLLLQSQGDHRAFCLAFAFTFRTFTEGVMGFAWMANDDVKDKFSGVCGVSGIRMVQKGNILVRQRLSKNSGIVSLQSFGERVTTVVSHLTLAHEIGHTLGSPHDLPENNRPECVPGGYDGMYIMYPYSVSGYDPNNSHFSPCSSGFISAVLDVIANGKRRQCFKATTASYCGNSVLEKGEECDCGYTEKSCTDRCCYPAVLSERDRELNRSAAGCARRADTQCSSSEGPCCQPETCRLIPASMAHQCRPPTECQLGAVCNGTSSLCPEAVHRPNYTECRGGSKVCLSGLCQGSVCLKTGLEECGLTFNDTQNAITLCEVACRQPGSSDAPCRTLLPAGNSSDLSDPSDPTGGSGVRLPPGSGCDADRGYCDVFGRCRRYRERGPLATVHRLLFTGEGRADLLQWLQYKWWAVLLIVTCLATLMAVTVRCCAVHTPSSNPRRPPARPLKDTYERPLSALGLPPSAQMRCWRRPVSAATPVPEDHPTTSQATGWTPSAPSIPVISDVDAWSEASSFEHLSQAAVPGGPAGGRGAPASAPLPQVVV
ncbi:disintegrin and metalloproteinase domain-containing protein 10-like [Amphibalanus amphitrite]|uniref:disintegrin and metalloproteinase domain-containing protein 10-like n=1 Tax=Amphibalanus amphitrite TaxID=1232801 RepID=UPI001C9279D1|nr:disintegrin and metalloproteinase domain-containing protein 10-like [Amphibalanus amphitrite]XP_043239812.1 disintegrin and metalloproteinase domain-containing protein 10-like [Amphibalanus amphitrite]XP_043239813.1 disintegrin and metalloproteinase domain-containing protein 10-like [Amphibalanus amphitrite]XP_043239814.1 disintegrin and metalloproteinase domain-containing protein 10-like [Amphibalanus amphitrite]XP_043239815.1 disintegrin and metalloproteinase domain-containing protein 10-l